MSIQLKNIMIDIGSIIDIYPSITPAQILTPHSCRTDTQALASDWQKVGDDMRFAMRQINDEQETQHTG